MSRYQQPRVNDGFAVKWLISDEDESSHTLPVRRGEYLVAVQSAKLVHAQPGDEVRTLHLCADTPPMRNLTYLLRGASVRSLKSFLVQPQRITVHDFTQSLEYIRADFTNTDAITLRLVDDSGRAVNSSIAVIVHLIEL